MHIAEVRLEVAEETEDDRALIGNLTDSWRSNGQVLGREFPTVFVDNVYRVVLMLPRKDSLESENDGKYVTSSKTNLTNAGFKDVNVTVLGEDPFSAETCACSTVSCLILYTKYSSLESPLRCGKCFVPVPLYIIPHYDAPTGEVHDQITTWESDYQSCDSLQMNCSTGEKFGLREISDFGSSLSKRGREICDAITSAVNFPTYYYLHRYRGRSRRSEMNRKCPSCGGEWLMTAQIHDTFDFKCDRCRLLSNIALSISR